MSTVAASASLQAALDSLDQGVCVFGQDLTLVAHNRRFVELLGFPEGLVTNGVSFARLARHLAERDGVHPSSADLDDDVARRVHAARHCVRSYNERTSPTGRVVAAQISPLPEGGFVTVYTDVTERRQAELLTPEREGELESRVNQRTLELRTVNEELRRNIRRMEAASSALATSEARLRLITDAIAAAMAYVDRDLVVRFANRRFAALFRKNIDRIVGRSMLRILGAKIFSSLSEHVHAALHGRVRAFEHEYTGPEGDLVITRNELVPEFGEDGAVVGLFVLSIDVTDEKKAERAVREAQKTAAIGQLAGGLAHDFNNLLTVIVGNLASVREQVDAALAREYLDPTIRASHRGVEVVRRLLAFARQQPLEPIAVDVAQLVTDAAQLLRRSFPGNIRVACDVEHDGAWPALVDPAHLESALVNLAINARDAMPEGGTLTFRVSCTRLDEENAARGALAAGDYVSIEVCDDGCGIPVDLMDRIFEPFYTTKPFGSGSGLGLPMVLGFARQSAGDVRVRSELARGTTVSLLLPRATGPAEISVPPTAPAAMSGEGRLVLLVEDNEDVRRTVRRHLLDLGYQVLEARDGDDARELLATVPGVAVLVSDVVMPGAVGGLGLADEARRLVPGIKIVLMSGFTSWSAGGYDWFDERLLLRKPFGREDLTRVLGASQ
jgi:PAS domain S-box-containing protein